MSPRGDEPAAAPSVDAIYIEARRALLDALTALEPHRAAVVVAGAQAIYLRTGDADIAVAPYTSDGDVALDPSLLSDEPQLAEAMRTAGFVLSVEDGRIEPGVWVIERGVEGQSRLIPIDLIVPEGVATGGGRRDARLEGHGKGAARRARGLECALVDHSTLTVTSLDPADPRSIDVEVAGPAALLIAKAYKLHDRVSSGKPERLDDKDAADVLRLMQATRPDEVGKTLATLSNDDVAGPVTVMGLAYLEELFGRRGRPGIEMAARALRIGMDEAHVEALSIGYLRQLRASAADNAGTADAGR